MFGLVTNDENDNLSYPPDDEDEYGRSQTVTISLSQLPPKRVYFWSLGGAFKGDLVRKTTEMPCCVFVALKKDSVLSLY